MYALETVLDKKKVWQTTIAAVSVLSLFVPRLTPVYPIDVAFVISVSEKSPSGPTSTIYLPLGLICDFNDFFSISWQCAMSLRWGSSACFSKKSLKLDIGCSTGKWYFKDCFAALSIIFWYRSGLIILRSLWLQSMGVIWVIPISVAFSKNHSNLSLSFKTQR